MPRLSNVIDAVAGPLERGHLMQVPRPARSPAAGDEQDGLPGAAVVVGQIHPADPTDLRAISCTLHRR